MNTSQMSFNQHPHVNLSRFRPAQSRLTGESSATPQIQVPHFSGQSLFGTEDKFGKKHWSINLTGLPLIDRALAYVAIPFVGALGLLPAHGLTPGAKNLDSLVTAYREVAQVDDNKALTPALAASMQQEKFREFITKFNQQVAQQGEVDAAKVLGQFPTFTQEDIQATQNIIKALPEDGSVDDIRNSIQRFKTEVLSKHFTRSEIAGFDKAATEHLNSLKVHENIDYAATLAAIIAGALGVGIFGLGAVTVFGALGKLR